MLSPQATGRDCKQDGFDNKQAECEIVAKREMLLPQVVNNGAQNLATPKTVISHPQHEREVQMRREER
jgi:hypothetical protein